MEGEFFELDLSRFDIDKLITKLNAIDRAIAKETLPEIMEECGEELLSEEKRILSGKYPKLAPLLTAWTEKTGAKSYRVKAGYSTEVIKNHIEGLIIEFGRPGKKGIKHGGKDTLGRKIGAVQPYSHIRAAYFLKKKRLLEIAEKKFRERLMQEWEK